MWHWEPWKRLAAWRTEVRKQKKNDNEVCSFENKMGNNISIWYGYRK